MSSESMLRRRHRRRRRCTHARRVSLSTRTSRFIKGLCDIFQSGVWWRDSPNVLAAVLICPHRRRALIFAQRNVRPSACKWIYSRSAVSNGSVCSPGASTPYARVVRSRACNVAAPDARIYNVLTLQARTPPLIKPVFIRAFYVLRAFLSASYFGIVSRRIRTMFYIAVEKCVTWFQFDAHGSAFGSAIL